MGFLIEVISHFGISIKWGILSYPSWHTYIKENNFSDQEGSLWTLHTSRKWLIHPILQNCPNSKFNKFCPPNSSDDLFLFFCIYPSSTYDLIFHILEKWLRISKIVLSNFVVQLPTVNLDWLNSNSQIKKSAYSAVLDTVL